MERAEGFQPPTNPVPMMTCSDVVEDEEEEGGGGGGFVRKARINFYSLHEAAGTMLVLVFTAG